MRLKIALLLSSCMSFPVWSNPLHIEVSPFVTTKYSVNDNVTLVDQHPISSPVLEVIPGVTITGEKNTNTYSLSYNAKNATYFDSKQDDYTDHHLMLDIDQRLTLRNKINFNYQYFISHEDRSDTLETLLSYITDPVKYKTQQAMLDYIYGADWARGRLNFGVGYNTKRFDNYRYLPGDADNSATRFDEYDETVFEGQFTYRPSDLTEFFVRLEHFDKNYLFRRNEMNNLDNNTTYLYFGSKWGINKKTQSSFMMGWQNKTFSQSGRDAFNGLTWRGDVSWAPFRQSTLRFETQREILDPDLQNDYRKETFYRLSWQHYWLNRLYSDIHFQYLKDEYTNGLKTDTKLSYNMAVGYVFNHYLTFVTGWTKENKDSTINRYDYDQNIVYFSVNFKLDSL